MFDDDDDADSLLKWLSELSVLNLNLNCITPGNDLSKHSHFNTATC